MASKILALIAVFAAFMTVTSARADKLSFQKKADRMTVVTKGEEVKLEDWLVKGKVTIFDFYSDGCPPCRFIKGPLIKAVTGDQSVALRVVDLNREGKKGIDWQSPVAAQYKLQSIPYFVIYDANGKEWKRGDEAQEHVQKWLDDVKAFE